MLAWSSPPPPEPASARPIADCRYDDLLILRLGAAAPAAINGHYGAESRCPPTVADGLR